MEEGRLLTAEEYFSEQVKKNAIIVDGHFTGWVNPEVMRRHGIEASAAEAWEKNGGGTFSFADSTGSGKKRKKGSISNAKVSNWQSKAGQESGAEQARWIWLNIINLLFYCRVML